jgi:hypothetical protein
MKKSPLVVRRYPTDVQGRDTPRPPYPDLAAHATQSPDLLWCVSTGDVYVAPGCPPTYPRHTSPDLLRTMNRRALHVFFEKRAGFALDATKTVSNAFNERV